MIWSPLFFQDVKRSTLHGKVLENSLEAMEICPFSSSNILDMIVRLCLPVSPERTVIVFFVEGFDKGKMLC